MFKKPTAGAGIISSSFPHPPEQTEIEMKTGVGGGFLKSSTVSTTVSTQHKDKPPQTSGMDDASCALCGNGPDRNPATAITPAPDGP
jgi:hypothetical protein